MGLANSGDVWFTIIAIAISLAGAYIMRNN